MFEVGQKVREKYSDQEATITAVYSDHMLLEFSNGIQSIVRSHYYKYLEVIDEG